MSAHNSNATVEIDKKLGLGESGTFKSPRKYKCKKPVRNSTPENGSHAHRSGSTYSDDPIISTIQNRFELRAELMKKSIEDHMSAFKLEVCGLLALAPKKDPASVSVSTSPSPRKRLCNHDIPITCTKTKENEETRPDCDAAARNSISGHGSPIQVLNDGIKQITAPEFFGFKRYMTSHIYEKGDEEKEDETSPGFRDSRKEKV
jgi:hypothetical protein